jgi:cation diffusion facilitator CzcD-associated flavoprotein CzcO
MRVLRGTAWFESSYAGERVALLAPGAEAAAMLPHLLQTAASVTVFEESPAWVSPVGVPTSLLRHAAARAHLHLAVRDRWTRRQLTPHRRFDSGRVVVNPSYYAALQDPRTRLVHWPAYEIVESGVRAADGVEYRVDTIVVARTSKFAHVDTVQTPRERTR